VTSSCFPHSGVLGHRAHLFMEHHGCAVLCMILSVQSVAFIDDFSVSAAVSGVHEVLFPVNHSHIGEMVCVPAELAKLQCTANAA